MDGQDGPAEADLLISSKSHISVVQQSVERSQALTGGAYSHRRVNKWGNMVKFINDESMCSWM